jgi:hypothetical protein
MCLNYTQTKLILIHLEQRGIDVQHDENYRI